LKVTFTILTTEIFMSANATTSVTTWTSRGGRPPNQRREIRTIDATLRDGPAIECRINAENPGHWFAPNPRNIVNFSAPGGPGIGMDKHLEFGYTISPLSFTTVQHSRGIA